MLKNFIILIAVLIVVQLMALYMPSLWSLYLTQSVLIVAWLAALIMWWDSLVDGAVSVAHHFGVSPLLVWLTVVAMGTSMPELFVNVIAALRGESGLLVANIVWSNISNLLFIWGTASIITPLLVNTNTLKKEIPISFWATLLLLALVQRISPWVLTTWEAWVLLMWFFWFVYYVYWQFQKQTDSDSQHEKHLTTQELFIAILLVAAWVGGLYIGWNTLVEAATTMAEAAGWSTVLIGASIVAIWTSVPELVTSVIAAMKRQADLAIGNIIGSNIFNILRIGSITSLIKPVEVPSIVSQDIMFLMGVTILVFLVAYYNKQKTLTRPIGILFVGLYIGYIVFLVWRG
jgi:cation:H+ antiporter